MNAGELSGKLVEWIRGQVEIARGKGVVLGLSGGVDSAVVAVLCERAFPDSIIGINLPCYSDPQDQEHAKMVANTFSIPYKVIVLDDLYDSF